MVIATNRRRQPQEESICRARAGPNPRRLLNSDQRLHLVVPKKPECVKELGAEKEASVARRESVAEALLRETRPDELTPREALDLVYRLKGLVAE